MALQKDQGIRWVDVKQLKKDVKDWKARYDTDMTKEGKNSAINLVVLGAKSRRERALMTSIDIEAIKLYNPRTL